MLEKGAKTCARDLPHDSHNRLGKVLRARYFAGGEGAREMCPNARMPRSERAPLPWLSAARRAAD